MTKFKNSNSLSPLEITNPVNFIDLQFRVYYYPQPQPEPNKFHKSDQRQPFCDTHTSLTGPFLVDTSRFSLTDRLTRLSGPHFGLILVKQYYIIFIFYSMCQIDFPSLCRMWFLITQQSNALVFFKSFVKIRDTTFTIFL